MNQVRLGLIGYGNVGRAHVSNIFNGKINDLVLTSVCDNNPAKLAAAKVALSDSVKYYDNAEDMLASGGIDAVFVCTPHYFHPGLAISALKGGYHVIVEKPAGVYTKQVREMIEVAKSSDRVFGIMYNQRTNPIYRKMRELILSGELGEVRRINWIITNWYRAQSYYDSGDWRATWAGEGGGVLLNQAPHQLDLLQWITGMMPKRIKAFCGFGKMHDIEVEDEVTAYLEYENGASGIFITSTGETPGTNRFEVSGDMGKLVMENDILTFYKNEISERKFNKEWTAGFGAPNFEVLKPELQGENTQHIGILQNFTNSILHGEKLIAPGEDGIEVIRLTNAFHLSAWKNSFVDMPVDEEEFLTELNKRRSISRYKQSSTNTILNVDGTY